MLLYYRIDANAFCPFCKYISCVPLPWWTCSYQTAAAANGTHRMLSAAAGAGVGDGSLSWALPLPLPPL